MPILTLEQLEAEIGRNRFHPVYLFLGTEEFLILQALASLRTKSMPAEALPFNFSEWDCRSSDPVSILQAAATFPMMSPRRLVVVTGIEELDETGKEALAAYVAAPEAKTVLVLAAAALDRRSRFYRKLHESAAVIECERLKGPALERWAAAAFARNGYRLSPRGIQKLVDLAGSDLHTLSHEIEKLILYAGNEKTIRDESIDALVQATRQHGIFELTAAMGKRDRKLALQLLANLLEAGEEPLPILGMMARHFRQVITARELLDAGRQPQEIGPIIRIPEFLLGEFLRQVRALEPGLAQTMIQRLAKADLRIKSSGVEARLLLEQLVCVL